MSMTFNEFLNQLDHMPFLKRGMQTDPHILFAIYRVDIDSLNWLYYVCVGNSQLDYRSLWELRESNGKIRRLPLSEVIEVLNQQCHPVANEILFHLDLLVEKR